MRILANIVRTLVLSALALVAVLNSSQPEKAPLKITNTVTAAETVVVEGSLN